MISYLPLRIAASVITLAVVTSPTPGRCQAPVPTVQPAATQMEHISIVSVGRGAPVVLIPGLASPRETWAGVVPALAKMHRVLLVQVNGFGGDDPRGNLAPGILDGVVADLHAYLTREKLAGAAVVGHSLGGLVAMKLALAHPRDGGRLMIVDSLPFFAVLMAPPGVDPTPAMVEPQAKMMRDKVAAGYGRPADPATTDAQIRGLALKPASLDKLRRWASAADARVTGEAMYEDLTTDLRPDLARIVPPITLIYPQNPAGPGKEMIDAFYRKQYAGAPHVSYVSVADSAHFVMLDQPEAFARALDAFLAS